MAVLQHLIRQIKHSNIKLDAQHFTEVCQVVKEIGITSFKMDRHHITMRLHTLHYKRLFPIQIADDAILAARTKPGGKHDKLIVRREPGLYHFRKILGLLTGLINRDTEGSQAMQVHEQVIDHVFHLSTVVGSKHIAQCHSVLTAQRMIGNKCVKAVFGQVLLTFHY